jgi:hypothetical protein
VWRVGKPIISIKNIIIGKRGGHRGFEQPDDF